MTAVLVFGDAPSTGHVARSNAERVIVGTGEGAVPLEAVLDLVSDRMREAGHVLALYPSWQPEPALRALQLAHASLGTERLILTPCSLPPLAFSLIADQIGYLAPYVPPGALVALVSALGRVTLAGAWTRSVSRLEQVPASLSQHMASYVPGGGFMVTASPVTRIHRITGPAPLGELPFRPPDPVHALAGGGEGGDPEWLQQHLLPAIRAQHVRPVSPPPLGEAYWGTKKFMEFVAFSGHPRALSVIANSIRCRPCPWCEALVATATCPLCGMVSQDRPETIPDPAPEQAPPPPGAPSPDDPGDAHARSLPAESRNGAL